jgi:hypothetical protein
MNELRRSEYPRLVGKTIRRARWSNDLDCCNLRIDFTDQTQVSFSFSMSMSKTTESCALKDNDLTSSRHLVILPARPKLKRLD